MSKARWVLLLCAVMVGCASEPRTPEGDPGDTQGVTAPDWTQLLQAGGDVAVPHSCRDICTSDDSCVASVCNRCFKKGIFGTCLMSLMPRTGGHGDQLCVADDKGATTCTTLAPGTAAWDWVGATDFIEGTPDVETAAYLIPASGGKARIFNVAGGLPAL